MDNLRPVVFPEPGTQATLLSFIDRHADWRLVVAALSDRFSYYQQSRPSLSRFSPTPGVFAPHREVLQRLYSSRSAAARGIRQLVRAIHNGKCPYCGLPAEPTQIDHFIPQDLHPEFSFYSWNLLPSCDACNRKKSATVWAADDARAILNPFSDAFLASAFFSFVVTPTGSPAAFELPLLTLSFSPNLEPHHRLRCERHFQLLGVGPKLEASILKRVRYYRLRYRAAFEAGTLPKTAFAEELRNELNAEIAVYGTNSWNAVAIRTILENDAYLTYITTVPIPLA